MTSSTTIVAALTVALLIATTRLANAQTDCASKLVPCAAYLNTTTKPSNDCCDSMKEVVTTQLPCLCGLLKNPSLLAGINITQALELPKKCNIPGDTSACKAASAPTSSNTTPPATPGGNGGTNAGRRISWMGMPAAFLLASALSFFY